jgi:dolichol-phosphate mannosyltransferase
MREHFPLLWEEVCSRIRSTLQAFVVYDFDEDDTVPVVRRIQESAEIRLHLVKNQVRPGVIGAIQTGLEMVDAGPVPVMRLTL